MRPLPLLDFSLKGSLSSFPMDGRRGKRKREEDFLFWRGGRGSFSPQPIANLLLSKIAEIASLLLSRSQEASSPHKRSQLPSSLSRRLPLSSPHSKTTLSSFSSPPKQQASNFPSSLQQVSSQPQNASTPPLRRALTPFLLFSAATDCTLPSTHISQAFLIPSLPPHNSRAEPPRFPSLPQQTTTNPSLLSFSNKSQKLPFSSQIAAHHALLPTTIAEASPSNRDRLLQASSQQPSDFPSPWISARLHSKFFKPLLPPQAQKNTQQVFETKQPESKVKVL